MKQEMLMSELYQGICVRVFSFNELGILNWKRSTEEKFSELT